MLPALAVILLLPLGAAASSSPQSVAAGSPTAKASTAAVSRTEPKKPKKKASPARSRSASSRPPVLRFTSPGDAVRLAGDLGAVLGRSQRSGKWGVLVVSLSRGDTLFGRNADDQLLPASTMKLFTSAMALERFGTSGTFETEVLRAGVVDASGVLHGDLILRGAGDPTLSGRGLDDAEPPMEALARQVAASGVKSVSGAVLGDASAFDDGGVPAGWRTRYLQASYAARVSALSFNENKVTMVVRPQGARAAISFKPAVTGVPMTNTVNVVAGSSGGRIGVRQDSSGRVSVTGWIGSRSRPRNLQVMVEKPGLFAAGALHAALAVHGVTVEGGVRSATAPAGAIRLAGLTSPTLATIVTRMNGESNNHFAELLFRNAARSAGAPGSAEDGNTLLRHFLYDKASVSPAAVFAADGSGLSTLDRVTPRAMVRLLGYARAAVWGPVFEGSLPLAGRTETLRSRMRWTPAMGNLRAKTGSTNDVASLGGYVTARNGEQLAFSFIYNGSDRWRARNAMDTMGATLASFSR